ncbi:DUF5753 domain-containing protein [Streptosporangium subroseum]|uniref:DUF5753 domain-containing protein n=1 Tax=Streptosporangium subroseum TaxID=106412 RepID=UPI00308F33C6|nr:DUF5753 domain-containing protein [Streptosporangium subroseum]
MYIELRRLMRAGSSGYQQELKDKEAQSRRMRVFGAFLIPGALQTREYATVRFTEFTDMAEIHADVKQAVDARMERAALLRSGKTLFHFVICETALTAVMAPPDVMLGQLRHLLEVLKFPVVQLGIIPNDVSHYPPLCDFWIMDDRAAETETYTASIKVTQPREVAMYAKVFDSLARSAVYGKAAQEIIQRALDSLVQYQETT